MKFYELDKLAREMPGNWRFYDWREVESMRNELAKYGAALSKVSAALIRDKRKIKNVELIIEELRAAKNYEISDRLRKAIAEQPAIGDCAR